MGNILNFLPGFKARATAVVLMAVGVLELLGVDVVPHVDQANAITTIVAGWGMLVLREGQDNAAAKAVKELQK